MWSPYQSTYLTKLESVQKKFVMFASPYRRDPTTYRLPPYNDRLNELGLEPLWCRRLVSQVTVIYDLLMGRMQCNNLRRQLIPNPTRRTRSSEWLNIPYHRVDYGKYEPLNACRLGFNLAQHIFLSGPSRAGFRSGRTEFFMQLNEGAAISSGGHSFERPRSG